MFLNVFVNKKKIGYCICMDKNSANILIVDDDSLVTKTLGTLLSIENYVNVELYNKPEDALEYLKIQEVDLILSDFIMPNMNGIEFLEALEKQRIKQKIIIVSTLAKDGAAETIRALELGAFDYVTKPDSFVDAMSDAFKGKLLQCLQYATSLTEDKAIDLIDEASSKAKVIGKKKPEEIVQLEEEIAKFEVEKKEALIADKKYPKMIL